MKNRILVLLCGLIPFVSCYLLTKMPQEIMVFIGKAITIGLVIFLAYLFGFLIMIAVYKFQDKEIDKLIEDVFFWIK